MKLGGGLGKEDSPAVEEWQERVMGMWTQSNTLNASMKTSKNSLKILWKRAQFPLPDCKTKTIAILAGRPYCHPLKILRGVNETCWYSSGSVLLLETSPSMIASVKYMPTVTWDFPVNSCMCSHLHIGLVCSPHPQPVPSLSVVMIQVLILSSHWNFQWGATQSSKKTWSSFLFLSFEELDYCLIKSLENPFIGEGLQNSGSWGRVTII